MGTAFCRTDQVLLLPDRGLQVSGGGVVVLIYNQLTASSATIAWGEVARRLAHEIKIL